MDVKYINPFIESTQRVFKTMLDIDVSFQKPKLVKEIARHDVSGIIGMSGDVVGSVVLSFSTGTARQVVGRFVGADIAPDAEDFADAVGELVNMISGAAKAQFEGQKVSISCPSVVVGESHTVAMPSDSVCITIPCELYCGVFNIDVAIRSEAAAAKKSTAAAAQSQTMRKSA